MTGCSDSDYARILKLVGDNAVDAASICNGLAVASLGPDVAVTRWMVGQLRQTQDELKQVEHGLDVSFVLTSAYQVFVMQLGFALFAAGVVRPKNVVSIFLKNFFDTCIAGIAFYLLGYAFAFGSKSDSGGNGFIGGWDFALSATDGRPSQPAAPLPWHLFVWNWSFCSAATTILSGSVAERATFASYTIYAAFMPAWVYPVAAHWLWSPQGWLSAHRGSGRLLGVGAIDYAGSGVVHLMGGMAALVAAVFVGPRVGRFSPATTTSSSAPSSAPAPSSSAHHSVHHASSQQPSQQLYRATAAPQLYLMGTFLLWFGWYGFNPGSRLSISSYDAATVVARTAVTTTLSACAGALTCLLYGYVRQRVWDLLTTCIGALAGLVAVTAGCAVLEPWAAIICGVVAAFVYEGGEALLTWLRVDDPVSAFPLHGACGAWGLLYTGLMAQESYVQQVYGIAPGHHRMGLFYGGHAQLLLCQVIAIAVIAGWSAANMGALFWLLRRAGLLRVGADKEAAGMDMAACGQYNAPGSVNVHSSKVATKGDALLAVLDMERRMNGGPGLDVSIRSTGGPAEGQASWGTPAAAQQQQQVQQQGAAGGASLAGAAGGENGVAPVNGNGLVGIGLAPAGSNTGQ